MKRKARLVVAAAIGCLAAAGLAVPAYAEGHCDKGYVNCYKHWESLAGAKHHGYIQIRASHNDAGRNAKRAYIRFMRDAGPALDTNRLYTTTATSRSDSTLRSREKWVWDSPLWGDKYTTRFYYGFEWF